MDDDTSISDSEGDSSSVNSICSSDDSSRTTTRRNKTKARNTKNSTSKKTKPTTKTRKDRSSNSSKSNAAQSQSNTSRSKLAREHRITAAQEQEIQEVFHIFAEESSSTSASNAATNITKIASKKSSASSAKKSNQKNKNHLASVTKLHISNLRRALTALSLTPTADELREYISILDPEGEGVVDYEPFVAICALKINSRFVNNEDHQREVDEAWGLFVREGDDRITLASLREVARNIGEDGISDELLRDMVLEANGGAGLARGVEKREFEDVMRKAGVWR